MSTKLPVASGTSAGVISTGAQEIPGAKTMQPITMTQQAAPSNPAAGKSTVYVGLDGKLHTRDNAGGDITYGAATTPPNIKINWVLNPDAETGIGSVTTSNGGTLSLDTTATKINGTQSFKYISGTSGSDGLIWTLSTIPAQFDNTTVLIEAHVNFTTLGSGNVWRVGLYNSTDGAWVEGGYHAVSVAGKYRVAVLGVINTAKTYTFRIIRVTGTSNADTFIADECSVGPNTAVIGQSVAEKIRVRYRSTSGQSIPSNTETLLTFGTKDYDLGGLGTNFDGAQTFTAIRAMTVSVACGISFVSFAWTAGTRFILRVFKNGTHAARLLDTEIDSANTQSFAFSGSTELSLAAGDTVQLKVLQNDGGSRNLDNGSDDVWMTISEITDHHETRFGTNSDVEYVSHDGTNVVYGPAGAVVPTTTPGGTALFYTIPGTSFSSGLSGDVGKFELEVQYAGSGPWTPVGNDSIELGRFDGTNYIGAWIGPQGSTMYLYRGKYRRGTGETWSTLPAGTRWRIVRSANPLGIGVPTGSSSRSGTVGNFNGMGTTGALPSTATPNGPIGETLGVRANGTLLSTSGVNLGTLTLNKGVWLVGVDYNFEGSGSSTYLGAHIATSISTTPSFGRHTCYLYWQFPAPGTTPHYSGSRYSILRSDGVNIIDENGTSVATQTLYSVGIGNSTVVAYGFFKATRIG